MKYWDSLTSHQKLSFGVFFVVGIGGLLLWPFLIHKEVTLPFKRTGSVTFKTAEQEERERTDRLRRLDTDQDGLNDYDEQYLFRTSPYVTDTDSDGIIDGTEVAQDTDPNCPQGKSCRQAPLAGAAPGTVPSASSGSAAVQQPDEARVTAAIAQWFGDPTKLTPESISATIESMSMTDLRTFLGELGIPATALQRADDATLRTLVTETLAEVAAQAAGPSGTSAGSGSGAQ